MEFSLKDQHVFLDLEQTLIESWHEPFTFNQNRFIRRFIEMCKTANSKFHIFSWAICSEDDMKHFEMNILPYVEDEFGIKITHIVTKEHCIKVTKEIRKVQVLDEFDLSQLIGKADAYFDFCMHIGIKRSILLDDTVRNSVLLFNDEQYRSETLHVTFNKG